MPFGENCGFFLVPDSFMRMQPSYCRVPRIQRPPWTTLADPTSYGTFTGRKRRRSRGILVWVEGGFIETITYGS
jgi:hypothetical protein